MNDGEKLARVLMHYRMIPDAYSLQYKIVCPFHADQNPSMLVDLSDGRWFCFGCQKSGDAQGFVKLMEKQYHGLNDLQAYKVFQKILKSNEYSDIKINAVTKAERKRHNAQLYAEAYDYYHGLSKVDWRSKDLPDYMEQCRDYMLQRGFTSDTLNACGCRYTYQRNYELLFPMVDNGKFRGWVSRTRIPEVAEKRKYLYNDGFRRATTVVGEYRNCETVYVVEGYMDRLKLVQLGVSNAVAILGWKASNQQIAKLQEQGITHVISALDNDDCGRRGTEWLRKHFLVTRFRYLKGIKDPGDFTAETFERMNRRTLREFESDESRRVRKETKNGTD